MARKNRDPAGDELDVWVMRFAVDWLVGGTIRNGSDLLPTAVTVSPAGEVRAVCARPAAGGGESYDRGRLYDLLVATLRRAAAGGRYRGAAVCALGDVTEPGASGPGRALIVEIDHRRHDPVVWVWPFEGHGGQYVFGGITGVGYTQPGARLVFAPDADGPVGELVESDPVRPDDLAAMRAAAAGLG